MCGSRLQAVERALKAVQRHNNPLPIENLPPPVKMVEVNELYLRICAEILLWAGRNLETVPTDSRLDVARHKRDIETLAFFVAEMRGNPEPTPARVIIE